MVINSKECKECEHPHCTGKGLLRLNFKFIGCPCGGKIQLKRDYENFTISK